MSILQAGPSIFAYHVLPALLASFIYYLLAKLFIYIFRIKKPNLKFFIFLIVLCKSVLVLITGARFSTTIVPRKPFGFGFQLYDLLDLMPLRSVGSVPEVGYQVIQSPWFLNVTAIVIFAIVLLLLIRWTATIWFIRGIAMKAQPININIEEFVEGLCLRLNVGVPKIVSTVSNVGPMTVGVFRPSIVLPQWALKSFSKEEIEVIIGHEIAHIKRKDNLFQWVTLFLKDVLFFSPFSRLAYNFVQASKEQAADVLFLRALPEKALLLARTIKKFSIVPRNAGLLIAKASFADIGVIEQRIKSIEKSKNLLSRRIISYYFAIFGTMMFFWIKVWIVIKVGSKGFLLMS